MRFDPPGPIASRWTHENGRLTLTVVSSDHEWFTKTIVAHGRHMAVWVNGYQVSDWTDPRPLHESARQGCRLEAGVISLQGHDPTTDLSFRNLRISAYPPRESHN